MIAPRLVSLLFACVMTGCIAGHNSYTLPAPAEGIEAVAAVETTWVMARHEPAVATTESHVPVIYPQLGGRLRLARDVDIGVRGSSNFNPIGLTLHAGTDVKWRFLGAGWVDLAAVPGIRGRFGDADSHDEEGYLASGATFHSAWLLEGPVLVGFAPASWVTVVLSPALVYGLQRPNAGRWHGVENDLLVRGVAARGGFGVDFKIERGFAVHPQITLVRTLRQGDERTIFTAGLGFRFWAKTRDPFAPSR